MLAGIEVNVVNFLIIIFAVNSRVHCIRVFSNLHYMGGVSMLTGIEFNVVDF